MLQARKFEEWTIVIIINDMKDYWLLPGASSVLIIVAILLGVVIDYSSNSNNPLKGKGML